MIKTVFAADLHGSRRKYDELIAYVRREKPALLFLGGDLLPHGMVASDPLDPGHEDFINGFLARRFRDLQREMGRDYPDLFLIMGNDDPRFEEAALISAGETGLWTYLHNRRIAWRDYTFYGYSAIPPSPFLLKDWERFDVSRFIDVGCVSPLEGRRTMPVSPSVIEWTTIQSDLAELTEERDLNQAVFLFHAPPYETALDLADLEGKMIDYVPLDPHIGSIAIKRFIEERQPYLTLHGHVHETVELSGEWREILGATTALTAAHRGEALTLVTLDLQNPATARRIRPSGLQD